MSLTTDGMTPADIAAVTGGNGMFGGDGFLAMIILFLIFGAWGNGGFGGGGNIPWAMTNNADMQRGFDQSALMSQLNGIGTAINNGFSSAEVGACNRQMNTMQGFNGVQSQIADSRFDTVQAITQTGYALNNTMMANEMARQQCCCDTKQAIADLKYTIATENCADRAAVTEGVRNIIAAQTASTQAILDKLCQQEIDALKSQNESLRTQLNFANLSASQTAQTAKLQSDNTMQTSYLLNYLAPRPVPAYIVPAPGEGAA